VAGISTLTSVNSNVPVITTRKDPTENPNPSSSRTTPSLSVPVAISVLNSAPIVMNPPASKLDTNTSDGNFSTARLAPTSAISTMTNSGARN
jgi:hypothetical protein